MLGNILIGKLKKAIMSKIGVKREYSPNFKEKLKELKEKQLNDQKAVQKHEFEGGVNPFVKLLQARPNKTLSEVNNDEDVPANPMAALFSGLLGAAKPQPSDKDQPPNN